MTKNHKNYLELAFQLAETNLGKTGLNPSVGCVIVKNDTVLSSGVTSFKGRPHSEFNALNKLKGCSGASLYTTMEPCTHYGKTPPCINIIIKKKIKNVFYGFDDPDIRTYQKAKKILKKNGIKAKLLFSKKFRNFYDSYFVNKKKKIPFVSAKIAVSKDYKTINKKNKWITSNLSRKTVHLIRNKFDCIVSTSKSINFDNALLNCRISGLDNHKPDLFIIDLKLNLRKKLKLNNLLKKRKTHIITLIKNRKKSNVFKKLGYKIIFVKTLGDKKDLNILYNKIFKMGYSRVLVETGLTFLNFLLSNKALNELYIFKSENKLGKHGNNNDTSKYIKKIFPKLPLINIHNDQLVKKRFNNV
tara:strand:+ start:128 stop:1201 length:1074 start_codon:yes stop_codon:yes gene_type:complete